MREDFKNLKGKVSIEDVARYLLGQPVHGMYVYPGEKTASLRIYPKTQSFYDFGRGVGGDAIKLWSHVKGCDSWTALQQISALYGLDTDLDEKDRKNVAEQIKAQEQAQRAHRQAEKRKQKLWVAEVERLKTQEKFYDDLLRSSHIKPLSDPWCWLINSKQMVSYRLDCLCGIE